jgi:hypothetical protein
MRHSRALLVAIGLVAMLNFPTYAETPSDPVLYLKTEARVILGEGDRIEGEANLMRSERARLKHEASNLRIGASRLDEMWARATQINAEKYADYPGRDRSQRIMRSDADREEKDAESLQLESQRLDEEAIRLWKLASEIDPRSQNALIKRMACCKPAGTSDIDFLRAEIIKLARSLGTNYFPK